MHSLAVKEKGSALGFDACGIARAGNIDPEDRLGDWIVNGFDADMTWIAANKEKRQDPGRVLPGAQSVIVVARNCYAPRPETAEGAAIVSRYAWGRDYHNVLRKPLNSLAGFVSSLEPGAQCFCSIDAGPVMEKAWAVRAGIGWMGKNGLVIREGIGSWMFLGVILTTLSLEEDAPAENKCGSCTRCIEACPTKAIVAPYVIDARRCISYQTVENRGEIPNEIASAMGQRIFGCDACQEACPWNEKAPATSETGFHPKHASLDLEQVFALDEAAFNEQFAGSPIRRAKRAGLRRLAAFLKSSKRGPK